MNRYTMRDQKGRLKINPKDRFQWFVVSPLGWIQTNLEEYWEWAVDEFFKSEISRYPSCSTLRLRPGESAKQRWKRFYNKGYRCFRVDLDAGIQAGIKGRKKVEETIEPKRMGDKIVTIIRPL